MFTGTRAARAVRANRPKDGRKNDNTKRMDSGNKATGIDRRKNEMGIVKSGQNYR